MWSYWPHSPCQHVVVPAAFPPCRHVVAPAAFSPCLHVVEPAAFSVPICGRIRDIINAHMWLYRPHSPCPYLMVQETSFLSICDCTSRIPPHAHMRTYRQHPPCPYVVIQETLFMPVCGCISHIPHAHMWSYSHSPCPYLVVPATFPHGHM